MKTKHKERSMKTIKTFKDLKNHPFVESIDIEYEGTEKSYWLYLVEGKEFAEWETTLLHEWTKEKLVDAFNRETIIDKL